MDESLRRMQRQASTGSVKDSSRLLRQRLRAADLSPEALELAAYLGDPAALEALEKSPEAVETHPMSLVSGLHPWGKQAVVRALIAACRHVLPVWEEGVLDPRDKAPLRALEAAEAWCELPSEKRREAAARALRAVRWDDQQGALDDLQRVHANAVVKACWHAARAAACQAREWTSINPRWRGEDPRKILALQAAEIAAQGVFYCLGPAAYAEHRHGMSRFSAPLATETLRRAIGDALIPWALGANET